MSLARQNYLEECEAGVNKHINTELNASYIYSSMAFHFERDDVALPGFFKFFKKLSDRGRERAEKFMKYQTKRGGRIILQDVKKPDHDEWGSGLDAMTTALKLEKNINQALLDLHKLAETKYDTHLDEFVEEEFLEEQVDSIKLIASYVTQLTKAGPGLGEYLFDKETLQESS
ncbi:soma ferritin-like isoform X1 [Physella acuta]|uniref:soma ferritin-like isoform X1 n=1 Tax=Physella acuta TaxID=109671 RepID=UPI0027DCF3A1|nr:soma ferritin-like isoform X1 [Physella acuta]